MRTMLGAAIRERRLGLGLSQEASADAISMRRAYYSKVERGQKNITLQTIWRVTQGLGVKPSKFLMEAGV